jgi:hypothetical protein
MATRFPPSVAAKDNEEKGYRAMADMMQGHFNNLGGWSTDPALKAYPETIRKNDKNCASFLPAYYRALTFLNSLQVEGMIDSVPSTKVSYSNVKNWMLAHLPPATLDAIPIAYQRKLFQKILLMIQSHIPMPLNMLDFDEESLKVYLGLNLTNLLSTQDIGVILQFIFITCFQLANGSFFPLDFATPKGAKLFSVVNVPSLELR